MGCNDGIYSAITSDCTTQRQGGLEVVAWGINRKDVSITFDVTNPVLITGMSMASTKSAFQITGVRKLLNSGHSLVQAEDRPDKYSHFFNLQQFEIGADAVENGDKLEDLIIIYERKSKTTDGDGEFVVRGARYGLYKSADDRDENNVDGARVLAMSSMAGNEEPQSENVFFDTDYATTKAAIVALLTPGT